MMVGIINYLVGMIHGTVCAQLPTLPLPAHGHTALQLELCMSSVGTEWNTRTLTCVMQTLCVCTVVYEYTKSMSRALCQCYVQPFIHMYEKGFPCIIPTDLTRHTMSHCA